MRNTAPKDAAEIEALETREWLESLDYVLQSGGPARVSRLLRDLSDHARRHGVRQPFTANTPYINTIPVSEQPPFIGLGDAAFNDMKKARFIPAFRDGKPVACDVKIPVYYKGSL